MFDRDLLLATVPVFPQRFHLRGVGPRHLVEPAFGTVLLRYGFGELDLARHLHREFMRQHHLCRQHHLDIVALGTVADVVRLDENNRTLVTQGLKRIRSGRARPGVQALYEVAGRESRKATAYDLGFILGPRLNAAGRLTDMTLGIECLLAGDQFSVQ